MIFIAVIFLYIALRDLLPLFREKKMRELALVGALFVFALAYSILQYRRFPIPSPMLLLDSLFKSVGLSY